MTSISRIGKLRTQQGLSTIRWAALGPVILAIGSLGLWFVSVLGTDLTRMNDLGLASVLSPWVYVAFLGITLSFCFTLAQRRPSEALLGILVVLLVFMLYGMTPLIEDVARFGSAWKHVGVIDLIIRTGTVDPQIDAYNNWPGFFILGALFTKAAGLQDAIPFLVWAPVFFNLIYLLPLRAIMLSITDDRRLVWLGLWFFNLGNWVGQDYFAPQAFGYFLYMVILAILLTWFVLPGQPPLLDKLALGRSILSKPARLVQGWWGHAEQTAVPTHPLARVVLLLIVVDAFLVIVASHQLTPFAMLAGVTALVLFGRLKLRGLPLIMGSLLAMWITYMTVAYLSGHLSSMLSFFGQLDATVGTNLTSRLNGSPQHVLVTRLRLFAALWLWGLAFLGGLRRFLNGRLDLNHALLALTPFPLIALQSYGGELLMRIYLFALPMMAAFAALLFFPVKNQRPAWRTALMVGLISSAWLILFIFVRFGNERMDYYTPQEYQTVETLYEQAPKGAFLAASSTNMPFRHKNYEWYKYTFLEKLILQQDVPAIIAELEKRDNPETYLILTRAQGVYLEMFYNFSHDSWNRLQADLLATGRLVVLYSNPDGVVYKFSH